MEPIIRQALTTIVILYLTLISTQISTRKGRVIIKVDERFSNTVLQGLEEFNFSLLFKITPAVYILQYHGDVKTDRAIDLLHSAFQDQIIEIEPLRVYEDTFKPNPAISDEADLNLTNIDCSRFYGKSVSKIWERNITGKDVTLAITDLGTDTDPMDPKENTIDELCGNLQINTANDTEHMLDVVDGEYSIQDHRNNVTSKPDIKMNIDTCGARFAYDATIVGMTIYRAKVVQYQSTGLPQNHRTISEELLKTFYDELDKTDICENAWVPKRPFDILDLASRSIIKYGVTKGRQGLGTIFVVPAGSCGNELSNNIYTISVNSIGRYGTQPYEVRMDASVLISGLVDENNSTVLSMVTPSYDTQCVTTFMGLSSAVSQVSGIIALGLQANPLLTLRDVQHLLVDASEHEHLEETMAFKSNGAFRHFHNIFGFGLLNASKFVRSAQIHKPVPSLRSWKLDFVRLRISRTKTHIYEFCYSCDVYHDPLCLIFIEQVQATVNFTTYDEHIKLEVISPGKTRSVLMDSEIKKDDWPLSKQGNLVSVHFWDEVAFGKWYIKVQSKTSLNTQVHNILLTLYGTRHASKVHFAASLLTSCGVGDARNNSKDKGKQQKGISVNLHTSQKSEDLKETSMLIIRSIILISTAVATIIVVLCVVKLVKSRFKDNSLRDDSAVEMSILMPQEENSRLSNNTSKWVNENLRMSREDTRSERKILVDTPD